MSIHVSTQHTTLSDALSAAVHDKFSRLDVHTGLSPRVHVVLHVDGGRFKVDAQVRGLGRPLFATAEHEDMYAAINDVAHLIDRQWRKRKTARLAARKKDVLLSD